MPSKYIAVPLNTFDTCYNTITIFLYNSICFHVQSMKISQNLFIPLVTLLIYKIIMVLHYSTKMLTKMSSLFYRNYHDVFAKIQQ